MECCPKAAIPELFTCTGNIESVFPVTETKPRVDSKSWNLCVVGCVHDVAGHEGFVLQKEILISFPSLDFFFIIFLRTFCSLTNLMLENCNTNRGCYY